MGPNCCNAAVPDARRLRAGYAFARHRRFHHAIVTNSSAAVGWIPTVASN